MNFSKGLEVFYRNNVGVINFVDDLYITITVSFGEYRSNDVNILVYRQNWNEIRLIKESLK